MNWTPPPSLAAWEKLLVDHFLAIGQNGDASDIRSFEVTPRTLAEAAGAEPQMEAVVVEAFRQAVRADPMLPNILRLGARRLSTDKLPNYFVHLTLTLFIDSLLDGDYASEGFYRTKLAKWLDIGHSFQQLKGVAQMWADLVSWLNERVKEGAAFRRLVLPDVPKTWTHIGYTRRLSFPSRMDIRLLERFVSEHPHAADNPLTILMEFEPTLLDRRASWGLTSAFQDFRQSYFLQRRALADHRFWRLLTRVRVTQDQSVGYIALVEMMLDEDGDRIYLALNKQAKERSVFGCLAEALESAHAAESENLRASLTRGVLFFRQCGIGRWRAESDLVSSSNGTHVALDARRVALVGNQLGPFLLSGGWSITEHCQKIKNTEEILDRAGLLCSSPARIVRASVWNGIRVQGAWLGRPQFLPAIEADTADLVIRSDLGNSSDPMLRINDGQLTSSIVLDGPYIIEPTPFAGELRPPWSLRLQFVKDAPPYPARKGSRHRLQPLRDWSGVHCAALDCDNDDRLEWEQGAATSEDLLEAIYADGALGWDEMELISLISRVGASASTWDLLRCLHDAALIEPRLREGWKGRIWTLVAPRIVSIKANSCDLLLVEGAICARILKDFQMAVEGMNGTCFRRLGIGEWSPPTIGAFGAPAKSVAELLNWPLITEPDAPNAVPLCLETSSRHAELYLLDSSWDWVEGRFLRGSCVDSDVRLTRRIHKNGRDHDIYRVEHNGRSTHFLSRTAAIVAAHAIASKPLFQPSGDLLVRIAHDGGLPGVLAADLRRRRLRSAGPIDNGYAYPVNESDMRRLASLLPECIAGIRPLPDQEIGRIISVSRRSGGQLRPQWRKGQLFL